MTRQGVRTLLKFKVGERPKYLLQWHGLNIAEYASSLY